MLSEHERLSEERGSGVGRRRQRRAITTRVSDVRKRRHWVAIKGDAS
jgi:hypothetical protein